MTCSLRSSRSLIFAFHSPSHDSPLSSLTMTANHARQASELIGFYRRYWQNEASPAFKLNPVNVEHMNERLMRINRSMFIQTVSSLEYGAKAALVRYPGRVKPAVRNSRLYLSTIMAASSRLGLSSEELEGWKACLDFVTASSTTTHAPTKVKNIRCLTDQR
jgi:hypothetical protein